MHFAALHLVQQRDEDTRTTGPDRMSERDGSTVDVQTFGIESQLAVDGEKGKYEQFEGNVATVYANPFCHGGSANGHYSGNAKTYMDVGVAMGEAMVELLEKGR